MSAARGVPYYDALLRARGGASWKTRHDLVVMYRALTDPADAARQWSALAPVVAAGGGELAGERGAVAGRVDRSLTADAPLYAVFRDGLERTYVAYDARGAARTVHFSDGAQLDVEPGSFGVLRRAVGSVAESLAHAGD